MKQKYIITILFKSGNTMDLECTQFEVREDNLGVMNGLKWTLTTGKLLNIDLNQIEAILSTKKPWWKFL